MNNVKSKEVAILGWGVDTKDIVPYLLSNGAVITVYDRKKVLDTKYTHEVNWRLGSDEFGDLSGYGLVIRSPGVYRNRPEIAAAEKSGVEISSKTKMFFDLCPAPIIAVTGTKGKGTTTTLIYEMLKSADKDAYLGGNIGQGVFGFLDKLTPDSWVVLELSSFQLIDLEKSPHIGVVLMTTTEHQDWHVSSEEYVEAKKPIVKFQSTNDFAVVNKDYPNSIAIGLEGKGRKAWISGYDPGVPLEKIKLRGAHNRENVAAAVAVANIVGIDRGIIEKTVISFRGLEHRLEEVAAVNGVAFYNDSFSTTPETTIAAIKSFIEPTILIAGGSEKGSDYTDLGLIIADSRNIKTVILIGLMAGRIREAIEAAGKPAGLELISGGKNMAEIVQVAYNKAVAGDVVLLSPGSASFDMFENYKDRGDQFKNQVMSLRAKRGNRIINPGSPRRLPAPRDDS